MKEETIVDNAHTAKASGANVTDVSLKEDKTVYFEASAFRVSVDVSIYDAPNGKVVSTWEAMKSFTSNQKRGGWIKITGYFVDKKWRPSRDESLWVEERFTKKR